MKVIKGDLGHDYLARNIKQKLAFDTERDFLTWKNQLKKKFEELLGMDSIVSNSCPLNFEIEKEEQKEGYKQIRFIIESEKNEFVPCYLLIPDLGKEKYPVAITLQGHSSGFHNSIGEVREGIDESIVYRKQFAVQAVKNGYAALAIEQRGMGERRPLDYGRDNASMCEFTAHVALLLGRTVLGERIWDVKRAIDALSNFDCLDLEDIFITGNSGGGTMSFYAACYDERIKLSVPSCALCPYYDSIMFKYHCSCNFIPHAYEWFDMQDLSCLIAPRKLIVVAGKEDTLFPLSGVERAYKTVKAIYEKANASENCALIETPKGHWWCEDIVWQAIKDVRN